MWITGYIITAASHGSEVSTYSNREDCYFTLHSEKPPLLTNLFTQWKWTSSEEGRSSPIASPFVLVRPLDTPQFWRTKPHPTTSTLPPHRQPASKHSPGGKTAYLPRSLPTSPPML